MFLKAVASCLFDIQCVAFNLWGYQLSYLELTGVLFGLTAVYLMAIEKRSGWLFGIVNVVLAAILYFQIQLYSDFFLQFYFFVTNVYGWWYWKGSRDKSGEVKAQKITRLDLRGWGWVIGISVAGTLVIGNIINRLHLFFPVLFTHPASYPFADTVVLTLSLIAQYLMAKKVADSWLLWIGVDILATYLYAQKEVWFLSFEFLVFTFIAFMGWLHWRRTMKSEP